MAYVNLNPAQSAFMFGVHSEWNLRGQQMWNLPDGSILALFLFRDDGPLFNGRQRHPDVTVPVVLRGRVDWQELKTALFYVLEFAKRP